MEERLNTKSWFEESKCGCQDFYLKSLEVSETHGQVPSQVDIFLRKGTSSKQPIFVEFYHVCESQKEHHPSKSYLLNLIDITLELWWVNSVKVMLPFWARLVSYGDRLWQNNRCKSRGSKSSRRGGYECCHAGECPDGGSKNKWGMVRNQKPLAKKSSKLLKIRIIKFWIKGFFWRPNFLWPCHV